MKKNMLLFWGLISSLVSVNADEVVLKNGATLPGEILKIHKDIIVLKTDFADEIKIKMSKVQSFKTDKKNNIEYADRKTVVGLVEFTEGLALVRSQEKVSEEDFKKSETADKAENETTEVRASVAPIQTKEFTNLWPVGENHPNYVEPIDPWQNKISLDLTKETGNTVENDYTGVYKLRYEQDGRVFVAFTNFEYEEKNVKQDDGSRKKKVTDENYNAGFDYERVLSKNHRHAIYGRYRWEYDRFDDLDSRDTMAAGYSYYILRDPKDITLRVRTGLGYRVENYDEDNQNDNKEIIYDLQAMFKKNHGKWGNSFINYHLMPVVEKTHDYIYFAEIGYELPFELTEEITLSLKTGVLREYHSEPSDESTKEDDEIYVRLTLTF
jgi:putative salt-induced outer membrane protein YdiY